MATLRIHNPGLELQSLGDFYLTVPPGGSRVVERPVHALASLPSLRKSLQTGAVAVAIDFSAADLRGTTVPALTDWVAEQLLGDPNGAHASQ